MAYDREAVGYRLAPAHPTLAPHSRWQALKLSAQPQHNARANRPVTTAAVESELHPKPQAGPRLALTTRNCYFFALQGKKLRLSPPPWKLGKAGERRNWGRLARLENLEVTKFPKLSASLFPVSRECVVLFAAMATAAPPTQTVILSEVSRIFLFRSLLRTSRLTQPKDLSSRFTTCADGPTDTDPATKE